MREVNIHKGTIWLGGVPDNFNYKVGTVLECTVDVADPVENSLQDTRVIALKLIPHLEPGLIGGLGAQFIPLPEATGVVTVKVVIAKPIDRTHDDGSVTNDNPINRKFAETVVQEAVKTVEEVDYFVPGVLCFDKALVHPIDSTVGLFRVLTRALILLMNPALVSASDDNYGTVVWNLVRTSDFPLMRMDYTDRFVR